MTRISMDPEVMAVHASMHDEAVAFMRGKLAAIPGSVDGGLASDAVAAIMMRVGEGVDALYRINGTLGEVVRVVADDAATNEQDVIDQLSPVATAVEDL
ncbi:hypothetical protein [Microbacterium sp. Leaf159]|uniref:hypothetical protein n=1 Tax=Microbacterium sp. Leaf159 TaxID=1736279 RepID=UPI000A76CF84|nr:hypothetical protein [Microbacterium sp. Leaf159]